MNIELVVMQGDYAVCQLPVGSDIPQWVDGEFVSITQTGKELSIICRDNKIPLGVKAERSWALLKIDAVLDFSMVGIIAGISEVLSAAKISIFVMSTYDTDYIMIKRTSLPYAINSLESAGYRIKNVA